MKLRVQVLLLILIAILGAVSSYVYFDYGCTYSAVVTMIIYAPTAISGILAQSFYRRLTLQIFVRLCIFTAILGVILQWSTAVYCDFKDDKGNPQTNYNTEKWLPPLATVVTFSIGARLIYMKIETLEKDFVHRLSIQTHAIVLALTFIWPIALGIYWGTTNDYTFGMVSYLIMFGIPFFMSVLLQLKHTKLTRNGFGYVLLFGNGFIGWFLFPLVAIHAPSAALQAWVIFPFFTIFCLLSGARFVKFYDTRHPEEEKSRINTEDSSKSLDRNVFTQKE